MDKCRILFLAANPQGTTPLALDKEIREIEAKIRASEYRDSLQLISKWAVRPDDLLQALLEIQPQVVHFSGHGSTDQIALVGNDDKLKAVDKDALAYLFGTLKDNIRLVVLNACYSRHQAELITQHIDCVVGMNKPIGDAAAIVFAASFYRAIGFGRSVKKAFEIGKSALMLEGIPEHSTPELVTRHSVDPSEVRPLTVQLAPPAPPPAQPIESPALRLWREKLAFLEAHLAVTADPAQAFALVKQIEQARVKIEELGG